MRSRTVHMPFGIFDRPARKAFLFGFATLLLNALPGFAPFDLQGSAFAAQEPIEIGEKFYSRTFGRNIATTASRQIGTPYRLGGQTPGKGFDCSGLVQWVYSQYGISVPRQTTGQQHVGRAVKLSEAMAGDLVVFRSGSAPHGLHTGIMTSHTTFVHAPRTGFNIREESINSYWRPRLISVRRVSDFSLVMNADEAAALIDKRQAVRLPPTPSARTQGHRLSIGFGLQQASCANFHPGGHPRSGSASHGARVKESPAKDPLRRQTGCTETAPSWRARQKPGSRGGPLHESQSKNGQTGSQGEAHGRNASEKREEAAAGAVRRIQGKVRGEAVRCRATESRAGSGKARTVAPPQVSSPANCMS